ncbi:MAG: F0F1 ATP synthase subunit B [Chloroflexia bacterium]|nr:F0F1 ATP synthase subunit B [Chloroflexia bacterium]
MDQLGINGWQLLIQLIAFLVFIWLLWKFAVGPIVNVLDQRQHRISESMAAAERMQAELRSTQARNEEVLLEARREAQDILSTARTNGEQMLTRAREEANTQAETYLTRAEESLRQESEQARQLLRREVADLAVMAAGRIIRKELDPGAQTQLIEDTLADASRVSTNGTLSGNGVQASANREALVGATRSPAPSENPVSASPTAGTGDVPVDTSVRPEPNTGNQETLEGAMQSPGGPEGSVSAAPAAGTSDVPVDTSERPEPDTNQSSVSYRPSRRS